MARRSPSLLAAVALFLCAGWLFAAVMEQSFVGASRRVQPPAVQSGARSHCSRVSWLVPGRRLGAGLTATRAKAKKVEAKVAKAGDAAVAGAADLGEWCALVVNLQRRPDRLQALKGLLLQTNPGLARRLERVDAVDGQQLTFDDALVQRLVEPQALERARRAKELGIYSVVHDDDNMLVQFDDHMTEGAIACAMSHRKALERVATHPTAEWGLILEDDVSVVVPHVERAIAKILEKLPSDWSALYLGYHHDDGKPHPLGLRTESAAKPVAEQAVAGSGSKAEAAVMAAEPAEVETGGVYSHCWGLFAWMVKRETARDLVDHLFPINTQVDGAISSWLVHNHGPGRVFCVQPEKLLFYSSCSEEGQDSDIQSMAREEAVIEEYGSWHSYMQLQQTPSPYESEDYLELFRDYGSEEYDSDYQPDYADEDWEADD